GLTSQQWDNSAFYWTAFWEKSIRNTGPNEKLVMREVGKISPLRTIKCVQVDNPSYEPAYAPSPVLCFFAESARAPMQTAGACQRSCMPRRNRGIGNLVERYQLSPLVLRTPNLYNPSRCTPTRFTGGTPIDHKFASQQASRWGYADRLPGIRRANMLAGHRMFTCPFTVGPSYFIPQTATSTTY